MAYQDYMKALKLGEKFYHNAINEGKLPYLLSLDDILAKQNSSETRQNLGLVEIPMEYIAGTYATGRTRAFAGNFMPLLEYGTEFSDKWSKLYDSMLESGLQEPITAYEYLNRFYVIEGNKRVSVSRFMGATSLEAKVTRILPPKTEDPESVLYYEFLDFYALTKINYLRMKKVGEFTRLLQLTYGENKVWSEDEQLDFKGLYGFFRTEYMAKCGNKLTLTVGQALLHYIEIFGYETLKTRTRQEIAQDMNHILTEYKMLESGNPISTILYPTSEAQVPLISKILPLNLLQSAEKIAFIYDKDPQISGWSQFHDLGRKYVEEKFGNRIITKTYIADLDHPELAMEQAIADNNHVIFTTSPLLTGISVKTAIEHPELIVLNCSLNTACKHMRTYYLRIYEAKFIIGAIAGVMTQTNEIGYIADYPIYGTTASINAFAMGVKLVNPYAKIHLRWSACKDYDNDNPFRGTNVDMISNRDLNAPAYANKEFGLYCIQDGENVNYAMPIWDWGKLYEMLIRSILNGSWKQDEKNNSEQALLYYWGIQSETIDVLFSKTKLPIGTQRLIILLKNAIGSGLYSPFIGVLFNQKGEIVYNGKNEQMPPDQVIRLNWLADNIIGAIPTLDEVTESAATLMNIQGLESNEEAMQ